MEGLIFGGAYVRREIWVSKVIGQAYSWKEILPFLFCFVLYLGAISKCKPPAVIFGGAIKRRVFCVTSLGGLIFGRAYTWRGLFSEFYGIYERSCLRDKA